MINLSDEQLKELQQIELELLMEFDRICRKHNIKYSLTGGTLLGAVRHGGFIPWDDDADISMLREEYEKFVAVCDKEIDNSKYYFQDIDRTPGYRWGYGKLRRKNTLFLREHQEHMEYEQGIFLDIFPRDSVPDSFLMERVHKFLCFCVRKIMWSLVGRYAHKSKAMRIWYHILYHTTNPYIGNIYHLLVKISSNPNTKMVRALTFPVPRNGKGYMRAWYKEYVNMTFENKSFMVEKDYKKWLEVEFGDYMQLPPLENRKVHPVIDIGFPD